MNLIRTALAGLLVLASAGVVAQTPVPMQAAASSLPTGRPRVGLVLGGGGARGAAHIGVLEVLERLRVPVDCVAGTSMGALVTGAYAAGLSPAEMREALGKADWADMFQDNPEFFDMSYRNKRISQIFLPGTELGVTDKGVAYAPGVVSGQKIKAFFNELVHADRGEISIENLRLPVSLIATDIGTGNRVVMRDGSLTQAMRASMSVPGLMAPVERNGTKLVDGGLVDNVPIGEARLRCNADIVIAVNVGSPLIKPENIGSLVSVSAQMVNILTEQNVIQSLAALKPTDIYIKPDLEGITSGDFQRSSETADRGRVAAEAVADQLSRLAVNETQYAAWRTRVGSPERPPVRVDEIEIVGLNRVNKVDVQEQISQKPGELLDTAALNADLLRVYGEGAFERVDYSLLRERDRNILRVTPIEKAWGPDYLRVGLGLTSDSSTGSAYTLRVGYHKTWIDSLGAELLLVGQIGSAIRLIADYYQPLEATQTYFVEPAFSFSRQDLYAFQDGKRVAAFELNDVRVDVGAGYRIGQLGRVKAGWQQIHKWEQTSIGSPIIPSFSVIYGGAYVNLDLDHLDRIYNPRNGWAVNANYLTVPQKDFSRFSTEFRGAYEMGQWVVQARASYDGSPTGQLPVYEAATLGGFLNLSAFAKGQLIGDDATYGSLRIERILGTLPLGLRGDMRLGLSLEAGKMGTRYTETRLSGWQDSYGLYIGGETPAGPVFLGVAHSRSSGYSNVYLLIGTP